MPLFSVVIPTYNRSKIILNTLNSVINQTCKDYEILIVDDGSTDDTETVIKPYLSDKIKYYKQENQGAQVARNKGLQEAAGKYIAFLDSDDVWISTFLEEALHCFELDQEVGVVYCWTGIHNNIGEIVPSRIDMLTGWIYEKALKQGYVTSTSFLIMKKECFDKIGQWDVDLKSSQDDDICFRLARYYKYCLIPKVLGIYNAEYEGAENRIGSCSKRVALGWLKLWQKYRTEVLRVCGPEVMAYHYIECSRNFYNAGLIKEGIEAYKEAHVFYDFKYNILLNLFEKEKIYCYGAGEVGRIVFKFLQKNGYDVAGFIVSDNMKKNVFDEYETYYLAEIPKEENILVIISTSEQYHNEICENIDKHSLECDILKVTYMMKCYMISEGLYER